MWWLCVGGCVWWLCAVVVCGGCVWWISVCGGSVYVVVECMVSRGLGIFCGFHGYVTICGCVTLCKCL